MNLIKSVPNGDFTSFLLRFSMLKKALSFKKALPWLVAIALGSFLGNRMLRVHGDEKVYVGQVLEMFEAGHWFQQLQFGQVNYIKGPLYYLLSRIGLEAFGVSLTAVLWMNFAFLMFSFWALKCIFQKTSMEILGPIMYATSAAVVLFLYSSQMESALASLYVLAAAFLYWDGRSPNRLSLLGFWVSAGLAGALKSPVHAFLLGLSALVFWSLRSELKLRLSQMQTYVFGFLGVAICVGGYLPGLLSDFPVFWQTYWLRENLHRQTFVDPYWHFLGHAFVIHLLPWSLVALMLIPSFFRKRNVWTEVFGRVVRDLRFQAAVSVMLPTFLLFSALGHYAPWYSLPLVGPAILSLVVFFEHTLRSEACAQLLRAFQLLGHVLIGIFATASFLFVLFGFPPALDELSAVASWILIGIGLGVCGLIANNHGKLQELSSLQAASRKYNRFFKSAGLSMGLTTVLCGCLWLISQIGEREMADLRLALQKENQTRLSENFPQREVFYQNLKRNNYSEWGLIAAALESRIQAINVPQDFSKIGTGAILLVPEGEEMEAAQTFLSQAGQEYRFRWHPWTRWVRNAKGVRKNWELGLCTRPAWNCLERNFWILSIQRVQHLPTTRVSLSSEND